MNNDKKTPDTSADGVKWRQRYDLAASNQEPLFKKFASWYDIANTVYPQDRKVAPWRSKVLFPTLGNKAWQLAAKFIGLQPGWAVKAKLPVFGEDTDDATAKLIIQHLREQELKAQHKLDYDYNCPEMDEPMREKLLATMMDAIVTGTGLGKVPWTVKNKVRYERVPNKDGSVDVTKEKVTEKVIGYNDLIPVNIFNVFISPSAYNLYSSPWVVIKEFKTYAELERINKARGGKFYTNLDQLKDSKATSDQFAQYKASRNRIVANQDPIAVDKTVAQLPLYECYDLDDNTISTYVAAGTSKDKNAAWVQIRSQKNIYWHGKYPLVAFYIKKKPHDFWGMGIFQTNERLDAARNDVFNHYMDNWNLSVDGGIIAEVDSVINDYLVEPGFTLTYSGAKPEQFKFPEPNPNQLTEVETMLDRALEDGTISAYSSGNTSSNLDTTAGTKGGILAIQESSNDILSFGRENFRTSITQVGKFFLSNDQQFMDEPLVMPQEGSQDKPMTISPADLQGDLDLQVTEDSMAPLTKDQQLQQFQAWFTAELTLKQASEQQAQQTRWAIEPVYLDFDALHHDLAKNFNMDNSEKVILSGDEVKQAMQNSQSPMIMPNERMMITPGDMFNSEVAQLLQRNGVTPDPKRQTDATPAAESVMAADAQATGAQAPPPDPTQITPDHLLKADAQKHAQALAEHKQAMEAAKMQQASDKQNFDQQHSALQLGHTVQQAQVQNQQADQAAKQPVTK